MDCVPFRPIPVRNFWRLSIGSVVPIKRPAHFSPQRSGPQTAGLKERSAKWQPVQIVGYDTGVDAAPDEGLLERAPALLIASDGTVERVSVSTSTDLHYRLERRHCAGILDGETHEPCDADAAPYCNRHASTWPCARCTGNCDLPVASCSEDHAVYIAGFAPATFKVGVTRDWRLRARLREQGADRAAHIRTVTDGRIARQIESDLAETIGDQVRVATKIRGFGQDVEEAPWQDLLANFEPIETFAFDYGLAVNRPPIQETLLSGTVIGTKGRVLVFDRNGTHYGVDMRDLVGYEVTAGRIERDRQSSLGSFE